MIASVVYLYWIILWWLNEYILSMLGWLTDVVTSVFLYNSQVLPVYGIRTYFYNLSNCDMFNMLFKHIDTVYGYFRFPDVVSIHQLFSGSSQIPGADV